MRIARGLHSLSENTRSWRRRKRRGILIKTICHLSSIRFQKFSKKKKNLSIYFFLTCRRDQEVNAAPVQRFQGFALKRERKHRRYCRDPCRRGRLRGRATSPGDRHPRLTPRCLMPWHTPRRPPRLSLHSFPERASPPGAGPPTGRGTPAGLGSDGTGRPGGFAQPLPAAPTHGAGGSLQGGMPPFFFRSAIGGSPKLPGLCPPRGWEPPVTVFPAGDGHVES